MPRTIQINRAIIEHQQASCSSYAVVCPPWRCSTTQQHWFTHDDTTQYCTVHRCYTYTLQQSRVDTEVFSLV